MTANRTLTTSQRDRATGLIIGMATGDALGAGYEFGPAVDPSAVFMKGGGLGPFAPGEWTDDTSMAIPMLRELADGRDLRHEATRDAVVRAWVRWRGHAPDVGATTAHALDRCDPQHAAASVRAAAAALYSNGGHSAGNGSLMRTAPLVLGFLDDPRGLATAAADYSDLTHGDPDAAEACVLWTAAQRHAVLHARFDLRRGLGLLADDRAAVWRQRIDVAETCVPGRFRHNGWAVEALQAAWSAITHTPAAAPGHFELALRQAVAIGHDTDTVAAIAGGLLGARWGVSAIPLAWREILNGWPQFTDQDLIRLVGGILAGHPWDDVLNPDALAVDPVVHPRDPGLWLGGITGLVALPEEVDAVVSLCRVGSGQQPPKSMVHVQVWLIDSETPDDNPHLDYAVRQAVAEVARLRARGRSVYLHCVEARSRTPMIASLYAAQLHGTSPLDELEAVREVLPQARPNAAFLSYLKARS